ncbi:stalk domain-containing protein [Paenibacillus sp. 1P07SE]|uniref:stalk domain-containing protein n=1 Tax=Paenibacillus sp. 1P07SE TaxID=3132209 RepID=UPI0039A765D5
MKSFKSLLIFCLLLPMIVLPQEAEASNRSSEQLVLTKNSKILRHNGTAVQAVQPVTFRNGSSYGPFKTMAQIYGFQVSYNAATKESIAVKGNLDIRFRPNQSDIRVNGQVVRSSGTVFIQEGFLMVPLRTWSELTGSSIDFTPTVMTFRWSNALQATFEIVPSNIFAGQTRVSYRDLANGRYVDEYWTGLQEYYDQPGQYTITRTVLGEDGNWSEPYSVTIQVRMPNQPPVADFTTDKTTYRIGERIQYIDRSTDDENAIVRRTWTGNAEVFFQPGRKYVTLEVEDRHGLKDRMTREITVTSEVLYTFDEYHRLFAPVGDKYAVDGSASLSYRSIPYQVESLSAQMVRSNSPETLLGEGIAYDDQLTGQTRFMFHHLNGTSKNLKLVLIATNTNSVVTQVGFGAFAMGGPDPYVANTGKRSVERYLNALSSRPQTQWMRLGPGESKVVLPDLHRLPMKPGHVLSAYADVTTTTNVRFRIAVVGEGRDPVAALESLPLLARDNKHVRGTFSSADRIIRVSETLGAEPHRLVLGDRTMDSYIYGIDNLTGLLELNTGNFGVLYRMQVRVAPNTVIALNARGGQYTGAFTINGTTVPVTRTNILWNQHEAAVLYRTGYREEIVDFVFTLASGSNLPIHMLFLPMPEVRW